MRWLSPLRPTAVERYEDGRVVVHEARTILTLHPGDSGVVDVPADLLVELLEAAGYERQEGCS